MKLAAAIHNAELRQAETHITATVILRPTPNGFMHRVEYDVTHLPSPRAVATVGADGKFSIL